MTRLEELRDKLAAGIDWHEDARTMRQLLTVAQAARNLDVRWRERDPETRISTNFRIAMRRLEDTLAPLLEDSEGSDANCLPTKVNTPQAGAEALEAKSLYCIPPGCICHGDGLMGMKCDAPEHARLKSEINPGSSSQDR